MSFISNLIFQLFIVATISYPIMFLIWRYQLHLNPKEEGKLRFIFLANNLSLAFIGTLMFVRTVNIFLSLLMMPTDIGGSGLIASPDFMPITYVLNIQFLHVFTFLIIVLLLWVRAYRESLVFSIVCLILAISRVITMISMILNDSMQDIDTGQIVEINLLPSFFGLLYLSIPLYALIFYWFLKLQSKH